LIPIKGLSRAWRKIDLFIPHEGGRHVSILRRSPVYSGSPQQSSPLMRRAPLLSNAHCKKQQMTRRSTPSGTHKRRAAAAKVARTGEGGTATKANHRGPVRKAVQRLAASATPVDICQRESTTPLQLPHPSDDPAPQ